MSEESVGDAGASNLGYFGGYWSPDGQSIVAHGYTGALHLWEKDGQILSLTSFSLRLARHLLLYILCCSYSN